MRVPAAVLSTLVGLSVVFLTPPPAPAQVKTADKSNALQMDGLMRSVYSAEVPGAAVIVVKDGRFLFRRGYGLASLELKVPVRPEMVFRLCSVTKQFTAAAI